MDLTWLYQEENVQLLSQIVISKGALLSSLILLYVALSVILRDPKYLIAFLIPEALFNFAFFDVLAEIDLYKIEFIVYSFILFKIRANNGAVFACILILILSILSVREVHLYEAGIYDEISRIFGALIPYISAILHIFFIYTLLGKKRILRGLRAAIRLLAFNVLNTCNYLCYNKKN